MTILRKCHIQLTLLMANRLVITFYSVYFLPSSAKTTMTKTMSQVMLLNKTAVSKMKLLIVVWLMVIMVLVSQTHNYPAQSERTWTIIICTIVKAIQRILLYKTPMHTILTALIIKKATLQEQNKLVTVTTMTIMITMKIMIIMMLMLMLMTWSRTKRLV